MAITKENEQSMIMLTILRVDAQRLYERIKYREAEYMHFFSAKRTRDHFPNIFKNKYRTVSIDDLKLCGEEVIIGLDQFYTKADEMEWYLMVTEDMPGTVQERVRHMIREIDEAYDILQLYINAELENYRPPSTKSETDLENENFFADLMANDDDDQSEEFKLSDDSSEQGDESVD